MDHVLRPRRSADPPEIPYLGHLYSESGCKHKSFLRQTCSECRKSARGWRGFLIRQGISPKIQSGDFSDYEEHIRRSIAESYYAWLYFGVISEYFEHSVDLSFLSKIGKTGKKVCDTTSLPRKLFEWETYILSCSEKRQEAWNSRAMALLFELSRICNDLVRSATQIGEYLPQNAFLSLHLLYDTLREARDRVKPGGLTPNVGFGLVSGDLEADLLEKYWCPSEIRRMSYKCNTLYYASLLGPRDSSKRHLSCSHNCVEHNIDESQYVVQHVASECNCPSVSIAAEHLVETVLMDKVPLVSYDRRQGIFLHNLLENGRYVAVSHVWAEGAGNPQANALPKCQLAQIQKQVDWMCPSSNAHTPWFMDTICIPVIRDHSNNDHVLSIQAAKGKIIQVINGIYSNAFGVLVRDSAIMQSSLNADAVEVIFRICFSAWATRIWTLMEAVSASRLFFCLIDAVVSLEEVVEIAQRKHPPLKTTRTGYPRFETYGMSEIFSQLQILLEVRDHVRGSHEWNADVVSLAFAAAQHRNTSHPRDEIVCMALVLKMPPMAIATLRTHSHEAQIPAFLAILQKAPSWLTFVAGERLDIEGFRWCPKRLVGNWVGYTQNYHDIVADGLRGKWYTIWFQIPRGTNQSFRTRALFKNDVEGIFLLNLRLPGMVWTVIVSTLEVQDYFESYEEVPLALLLPELHVGSGPGIFIKTDRFTASRSRLMSHPPEDHSLPETILYFADDFPDREELADRPRRAERIAPCRTSLFPDANGYPPIEQTELDGTFSDGPGGILTWTLV